MKTAIPTLLFASLALVPASAKDQCSSGDWLQPFEHVHASKLGTPIPHAFNVEPAITGRDLFTTYRYRSSDEATEHEVEMELEWALSRRLGVIFEAPYAIENERGGPRANGFGDLAVVPRALLIETDRFMLTAQTEVVLPTATNDFEAETAIAPGIVTWLDLGNWWTLTNQFAVEHGFDSDSTEGIYGIALIKSFGKDHAGHHHHASTSGLNLHLEVTGSVGLNGEENGDVYAEGLLGMSYGLCSGIDVRVGYEFPLTSPETFDYGWVAGCVWHF